MCRPGQPPAPATAAQATAMAEAGLGWLAGHDAAQLTGAGQAGCLRGLGRAQAMHTAAQGAAVEIVPAYLRRLVITRDRHCRFPGCHQPAMACHPHHIIPRSEGGPTSLANLLLCAHFTTSSPCTGGAGASS